jgi:hypothetical protein
MSDARFAPLLLISLAACSIQARDSAPQPARRLQLTARAAAGVRVAEWILTTDVLSALDPRHPYLRRAQRFADTLWRSCGSDNCHRIELIPLFPAGDGAMVAASVHGDFGARTLTDLYVEPSGEEWRIRDELPPEIEGRPSQLELRGHVELEPALSFLEATIDIELLSGGQPYLLFDFFPVESGIEIEEIRQGDKDLRFVRHGNLLVVELSARARRTTVQVHYAGTLRGSQASQLAPDELLLFENWIPYLGGAASWDLTITLPSAYHIALPQTSPRRRVGPKAEYVLRAPAQERLAIIGAAGEYHRDDFEYSDCHFEVWLRPQSAHRAQALRAAVQRSLEAFDAIAPFPVTHYRIVEAPYATGQGAFGLVNTMVLGSEVLGDEQLLQTVAHELAHSWFAGKVRDRGGRWSEAVASYLSLWPLAAEDARKARWSWVVAYEQVPDDRDQPLLGEQRVPDDADLRAAIFYSKGALLFEELERRHGARKMRQILGLFVYQYQGLSVGWAELQQSVADVLGNSESYRLGEWLEHKGGPDFSIEVTSRVGANIVGTLEQSGRHTYEGSIDLGLLDGFGARLDTRSLAVSGRVTEFAVQLPDGTEYLALDPDYTMPRRSRLDGRARWTYSLLKNPAKPILRSR